MCSLISLVNDNHMVKNLFEVRMYVYCGSIVNSQPQNGLPLKNGSKIFEVYPFSLTISTVQQTIYWFFLYLLQKLDIMFQSWF